MSRYVRYHRDGTVRMDWYTFKKMKVDKIVDTCKANAKPVTLGTRLAQKCGFHRNTTSLRPVSSSTATVKEFA